MQAGALPRPFVCVPMIQKERFGTSEVLISNPVCLLCKGGARVRSRPRQLLCELGILRQAMNRCDSITFVEVEQFYVCRPSQIRR